MYNKSMPSVTPASSHLQSLREVTDRLSYGNLLDQCFEVPSGSHFLDDFPVWDPRFAVQGRKQFGIFQDTRLITTASARIGHLRAGSRTIEIGIIGGVATCQGHRGRGLASQVVKSAVQWLTQRKVHCVFLWSDQEGFYKKLGFNTYGEQLTLTVKEALNARPCRPTRVHEGWIRRLFDLIVQRTDGLVLSRSDLAWYESHKNVSWFYTGSPKEPKAFVAFGRGLDLQGYIHQWGGDPDEVKIIFQFILQKNPQALVLGSVPEFERLQMDTSGAIRGPLAMAKLLCGASFDHEFPQTLWIWGLDAA
jgi:N-acetylglutamate synthase-like GNAT family acetyltransferase